MSDPILLISSTICRASSRVGDNTNTLGPFGGGSFGCASMCNIAGRINAKVFPEIIKY